MSVRLLVACDAVYPERTPNTCRAFLTIPLGLGLDAARRYARDRGWTRSVLDLCPSCTRARGVPEELAAPPAVDLATSLCHAGSDGECTWVACPQLADREPRSTGRHCPLDVQYDDWGDPDPAGLARRAAYVNQQRAGD